MQSRSYYLGRRYSDVKHFRYGFSRSGDFVYSEVGHLEKYGSLFKALTDGLVSDPNEEDEHFLKMLKGEVPADTPAEKTWLKYLKRCNRAPVWLTTRRAILDGEQDFEPSDGEDTDISDDDDDFDDAMEA